MIYQVKPRLIAYAESLGLEVVRDPESLEEYPENHGTQFWLVGLNSENPFAIPNARLRFRADGTWEADRDGREATTESTVRKWFREARGGDG